MKIFKTNILIAICLMSWNATAEVYSLEELVGLAKTANYEVRSRAENVYQSRKNIQVRMGRLLPGLNFGAMFAAVEGNYIVLISNLFGFLFPSNWFSWKESNHLYWASKKSYVSLIANQINGVESLFYQVQLGKSMLALLEQYQQQTNGILNVARARAERGENTRDFILQLENIKYQLNHDRRLMDASLAQTHADLAHAVGLAPSLWPQFQLEPLTLPEIDQAKELSVEDFQDDVLESSYELKAFASLIMASGYSRKVRTLEFLTPGGNEDGNLGFGYTSYLKIGKSQTKNLKIRAQEMKSKLLLSLERAVDYHNLALRQFKNNLKGFGNAEEVYRLLEEKFLQSGKYDATGFIKTLKSLFKFHALITGSLYRYLNATAQLNRLTMGSPIYESLLEDSSRRSFSRSRTHSMPSLSAKLRRIFHWR